MGWDPAIPGPGNAFMLAMHAQAIICSEAVHPTEHMVGFLLLQILTTHVSPQTGRPGRNMLGNAPDRHRCDFRIRNRIEQFAMAKRQTDA